VDEVLRRLLFMLRWLLTGGPHRAEEELLALRESVAALRRTTADLTKKLTTATETGARQADQLRLIQGTLSRLQDDQHDRHADLGAQWQKLLGDRSLVTLVERAAALAPDRAWEPQDRARAAHWARVRDEARVLRTGAELLTAAEEVDREALERLLVPAGTDGARERAQVGDLAARAAGLHRAASALKHRPVFDFSPPQPVVTPETAILYSPDCGYGRPAAYVVLPAYRLGEKRLTLPTVLTVPGATTSPARTATSRTDTGEEPA
jgi:hypothetical protein